MVTCTWAGCYETGIHELTRGGNVTWAVLCEKHFDILKSHERPAMNRELMRRPGGRVVIEPTAFDWYEYKKRGIDDSIDIV